MNVAQSILLRGIDSAPAVIAGDVTLTYAELRREVRCLASALLARGCRRGDRIGLFAENSPFFVTAYLGILQAGLVAVPFQTESSAHEFTDIALRTRMRLVLVSRRFLKRVRPWAQEIDVELLAEGMDTGAVADSALTPHPIDIDHDLAAVLFTSGSTGSPKGVMVTHRNILCNSTDIISYLGLSSEDRAMVVLPFHYCFGLSLLHTHLMAGASLVLNNDFRLFPEPVLIEMRQRECTGLAGVPSTFQILLRRSRFRELDFPKLRWFQQAGGKLPDACILEVIHAFPQVDFFCMYGQTEATARLSYLPPEKLTEKLGSIGKGLPSSRLEVLRPDGSPVAPGSGQTGEIVATGPNVAPGYWDDPQETARVFQRGRLHTGDIARVDRDGFIFIVGREKEIIKSGGNRVSAKEVEEVIAELPGVFEGAVLGVPHDMLGEAILAVVVPASETALTPRDVEIHCRKRLPSFKCPTSVIFQASLPHGDSGKLLKPKLRDLLLSNLLAGKVHRGLAPSPVVSGSLVAG